MLSGQDISFTENRGRDRKREREKERERERERQSERERDRPSEVHNCEVSSCVNELVSFKESE